jgi:hypothetical protein
MRCLTASNIGLPTVVAPGNVGGRYPCLRSLPPFGSIRPERGHEPCGEVGRRDTDGPVEHGSSRFIVRHLILFPARQRPTPRLWEASVRPPPGSFNRISVGGPWHTRTYVR